MAPIDIPDGVHPIAACSIHRRAGTWPFAEQERAAISQHWNQRSAENAGFFNGRVHIMTQCARDGTHLSGELVETDFATSLFWRDTGYRDATVLDCFGSAILVGADGALIYGRQASGNVNAGLIYPPSGFIDRRDIAPDGRVDFDHGIGRELVEETGLDLAQLKREPGYVIVHDGPLLSVGIVYRAAVPAAKLVNEITARLTREEQPELVEVIALTRRSDLEAHAMPNYARRLAAYMLPA